MSEANTQTVESSSFFKTKWIVIAVGVVSAIALGLYLAAPSKRTVETFAAVPDFQFSQAPLGTFGSKDLKGKVWVGGFIFTSCGGICPIVSSKMKRLSEAFADSPNYMQVSFSIDPARDTLPVLDKYRKKWAERPAAWRFLRPSREEMKAFSDGLKLAMGTVGDFTHTSRLVLVDKRGWVRGYYSATDEDQLPRLKADIRSILEE